MTVKETGVKSFSTMTAIRLLCPFIVAGAVSFVAFASVETKDQCIEQAKADQIFAEYNLVTQQFLFSSSIQKSFDRCKADSLEHKAVRALLLLKELPDLENSFNQFNQGILTSKPETYLKERSQTIIFEPESARHCTEGVGAYVVSGRGNDVHFCPLMKDLSLLTTTEVLLHEARHLDKERFPHVSCERGPYAGYGEGCDPSYDTRGSYGVGAEFNVRIARSANLPLALTQEARANSIQAFIIRFNDTPFSIREGAALQGEDGWMSFFDGKSIAPMFMLESPSDVPLLNDFIQEGLISIYSMEKNLMKVYLFEEGLKDLSSERVGWLHDNLPSSDLKNYLDYGNNDSLMCLLTKSYLSCSNSGKFSGFTVTSLRPRGLLKVGDSFAIASDDGYAYMIDKKQVGQAKYGVSDLKRSRTPWNLMSLAPMTQSLSLGVGLDGVLRRYITPGEKGAKYDMLEGKKFRRVLGPIWWSKELEAL